MTFYEKKHQLPKCPFLKLKGCFHKEIQINSCKRYSDHMFKAHYINKMYTQKYLQN